MSVASQSQYHANEGTPILNSLSLEVSGPKLLGGGLLDFVLSTLRPPRLCEPYKKIFKKSPLALPPDPADLNPFPFLWQIYFSIKHLPIYYQSLSSGNFDQFPGPFCPLAFLCPHAHPHNGWQGNLLQQTSCHQLEKRANEGSSPLFNSTRICLLCTHFTLRNCSWSDCSAGCLCFCNCCGICAAVLDITKQSKTFKSWFESDICAWRDFRKWHDQRDENQTNVHLAMNSCLRAGGVLYRILS